jgi:hypothetical protein
MFVDPSGLNEEDVKKILSDIENNHGMEVPGYKFEDLTGRNARAQYDYGDNVIVLDNSQRCAQLSEDEFLDLYGSLYHETRHHNEPWYHTSIDAFVELVKPVGPFHEKICDDTSHLKYGMDGYYDQIMDLYGE